MTEDYLAPVGRLWIITYGGQEFIPSKNSWSIKSSMALTEWCCCEFSSEEGSKDSNDDYDDDAYDKDEVGNVNNV